LAEPDFKGQQPSREQVIQGISYEGEEDVQPFGPRKKSYRRFPVPHFRRQSGPVPIGDVGRVRHQDVKALTLPDGIEEGPFPELQDPGQSVSLGVCPGRLKGLGGCVGADDLSKGAFFQEGKGDRTGAGPDVQSQERLWPPYRLFPPLRGRGEIGLSFPGPGEDLLHQDFRLGPGDQGPRIGEEIQLPEGSGAEDVLEGFPGRPALQKCSEGIELPGEERPVMLKIEIQASEPQHVGKDVLGIQAAAFDPLFLEVLPAPAG